MPSAERLILVSALVSYIPYGYMNVVPLVYLLQVGYNPATIGAIYAASSVAVTAGMIPAGILADRYGLKKFLIAGNALPAISYAIFGLTLDPRLLVLASVIGGIGFSGGLAAAMTNVSTLPILTKIAPATRRTMLAALIEADWVAAQSIGSVLSFLPNLLESHLAQSSYVAHSESYLLMAALAGFSTIPLLFVVEPNKATRCLSSGSGQNDNAEAVRNEAPLRGVQASARSKVLKLSIVFGLSGLGVGVLIQLLPTWYNLRFGVSEGTVGVWMALAQIASLVSIPLIPILARRKGVLNTSVATGILGLFFLVLMPIFGQFQVVALLFVARSILWAISWTVLQSFALGVTAENKRATTFGVVYAAWGAASSMGVFIGSEFLNAGLLYLPFAMGSVVYLGYSVALLVFFRKTRTPEEMPKD